MFTLLKKATLKIFLFYSKFQILITTLFIFGLLDLLIYTDVIMSFFAIPELTPFVIAFVIIYGVYRYVKARNRK